MKILIVPIGLWNCIAIDRPETKKRCVANNVLTDPIKIRFIKVKLSNGLEELLVTSLLNKKKYPRKEFKGLYALRWSIEEDYKTKKVWMEYENFSGKSSESVLQDIFAKLYTQNVAAIIAFAAIPIVQSHCSGRKYDYQINRAQVISKMKHCLFKLTTRTANKMICYLIELFAKTVEPIRPNRKNVRKPKIRQRQFYPQYKTIR